MRYDISKSTAPTMPTLGKGTKCIKILLQKHQKAYMNPLFRYFFLYLANMSAFLNFNNPSLFRNNTGLFCDGK